MNKIQIAAKLEDCRNSAKFLHGDQYGEKIKPFTRLINETVKANNIQVLPAAIKIAALHADNGMATMMIFSAALDLIET